MDERRYIMAPSDEGTLLAADEIRLFFTDK